ncbi:hypothetical protein [Streptomyces spectabilis]|uniref:hypothetical protein n=1 Tax=Streptomyces spectabilis TaxID=68270 RepID=UPI0033CE35E7
MTWTLNSPNPACLYCGAPLSPRDGRGRPLEHCNPACRQAAYRERVRAKRERQDGNDAPPAPATPHPTSSWSWPSSPPTPRRNCATSYG